MLAALLVGAAALDGDAPDAAPTAREVLVRPIESLASTPPEPAAPLAETALSADQLRALSLYASYNWAEQCETECPARVATD